MAIPKYSEMYNAFLECVKDGEIHCLKDIKKSVVSVFGISAEELTQMLPSNRQTIFDNRIGWTRTYLKKAGLIESPARAQFRITTAGKRLLLEGLVINDSVLMRYPSFIEFIDRSAAGDDINNSKPITTEMETPQEILERVYSKVNEQLADDLLSMILAQTPDFFESMVVKLLEKMGYGGAFKGAGIVTQSSRDEGIDGIINEDKLGFNQICIQAKRWDIDHTVGRPEIQKFVGALVGQGVSKGVFITTARFSYEAEEYAGKQHTTKVILIDGKRLAALMIEYELGITTEYVYKIKKIDSDFFAEE